ncbi:DUF2846 domain-containing protein [Flavobacterium sp. SM15]|uniref:DUF2846 domain-containing protein n=1 Tax=Flavobacterium sp. SM15 TaxID=2908005 RepID=UPI001EDA82A8|nr:DUF2846 domain-containing protein [Flavobacterium sp. SM15]MCG2610219.1 DUF2846 domain-containing protein [Flavobacterium sp. SM15]
MKFNKTVAFLFVFFSFTSILFAQDVIEIKKPSEGKSLVYFTRSLSVAPLVNFRIYENDKFIGKISYGDYILYECDPGEHMFWATSENRDYVETNFEPNKVYVIDVQGRMGAFIASVNLEPLDPKNFKHKKNFHRALKKHKEVVYNPENVNSDEKAQNIADGLARFKKLKDKESDKIKKLYPFMFFQNANKPE